MVPMSGCRRLNNENGSRFTQHQTKKWPPRNQKKFFFSQLGTAGTKLQQKKEQTLNRGLLSTQNRNYERGQLTLQARRWMRESWTMRAGVILVLEVLKRVPSWTPQHESPK
jgi:hypothetical protein